MSYNFGIHALQGWKVHVPQFRFYCMHLLYWLLLPYIALDIDFHYFPFFRIDGMTEFSPGKFTKFPKSRVSVVQTECVRRGLTFTLSVCCHTHSEFPWHSRTVPGSPYLAPSILHAYMHDLSHHGLHLTSFGRLSMEWPRQSNRQTSRRAGWMENGWGSKIDGESHAPPPVPPLASSNSLSDRPVAW